jgi:hypothetical protein
MFFLKISALDISNRYYNIPYSFVRKFSFRSIECNNIVSDNSVKATLGLGLNLGSAITVLFDDDTVTFRDDIVFLYLSYFYLVTEGKTVTIPSTTLVTSFVGEVMITS